MRREHGVYVCSIEEMKKEKFQWIIVPEVNIPLESLKVKETYYNDEQYIIRNLFSEELPEGSGIDIFKKVIYAQIGKKGLCGCQIPEILISEKVLKFLEG